MKVKKKSIFLYLWLTYWNFKKNFEFKSSFEILATKKKSMAFGEDLPEFFLIKNPPPGFWGRGGDQVFLKIKLRY
jgi:hypothetical protein